MNVSDFLTSFFSIQSSALKPGTSPAIRQAYALASNFVIGPMPERPSTSPCQVGSLPTPSGEIIPIPVTTTRRLVMRLRIANAEGERNQSRGRHGRKARAGWALPKLRRVTGIVGDVVDGVPDGLDLLGLIIGNLDSELFFEGHDQLDGVERVRSEVFDERRFGLHFLSIDTELLDDD